MRLSRAAVLSHALRLGLAAAVVLLGAGATGWALEPSTPLASYGRQAWGMENGLPQNTVQALVQTQDGFIWLGTEVGLVRFDGNSFQVFDQNTNLGVSGPLLPGNDVRCLLETPDGALWIGTGDGLARWKDGGVTTFTTKDGLPDNRIEHLDPQGNSGIRVNRSIEFQNGRWLRVVLQRTEFQDGSRVEYQAHLAGDASAVGNKNFIEVWSGSKQIARLAVGKELPGSRIQVLFADREGGLWIGTNGGLARWADGKVQRFPVTDPLAGATAFSRSWKTARGISGWGPRPMDCISCATSGSETLARGRDSPPTQRRQSWKTARERFGWERAAAG